MYEPVGTVDHFVSCDEDRRRAYDWANYRYAAAGSARARRATAPGVEPDVSGRRTDARRSGQQGAVDRGCRQKASGAVMPPRRYGTRLDILDGFRALSSPELAPCALS